MVEELAVEMAAPHKRPFWRTGRGMAIIGACVLIILGAFLSWWLANGTIKSISARLDTMVYTVAPEFATRIEKVLVTPGQDVQSQQPLATMDISAFMSAAPNGVDAGISNQLNLAMRTERQLTSKANQARAEEDRLQKIYQELVTNHVRVQLALRSGRGASYQQLAQAEAAARAQMEEALALFEQASRGRAALERELNRIRYQLIKSGVKPETFKAEVKTQPENLPQIPNELLAPASGRIMRVDAHQGEAVERGQTLFVILPTGQDYLNNLWVEAWFPVDSSKTIETGQKALIKFANNVHLEGKVEDISQPVSVSSQGSPVNYNSTQANRDQPDLTKYVPVRIALDNPADARALQPGAKADCQIQTRYLLGLTWFD